MQQEISQVIHVTRVSDARWASWHHKKFGWKWTFRASNAEIKRRYDEFRLEDGRRMEWWRARDRPGLLEALAYDGWREAVLLWCKSHARRPQASSGDEYKRMRVYNKIKKMRV